MPLESDNPLDRYARLDDEILQMMTEVEIEILKNAWMKRAKNEELTIVVDVLVREYEIKLQARELKRKSRKENE